jgi:hypothetical protein
MTPELVERATKERPIIFSAPMVRAILGGRKTQTRRVLSPQPHAGARWNQIVMDEYGGWTDGHGNPLRRTYGQPGDRLWVRETWRTYGDRSLSECVGARDIQFAASSDEAALAIFKWRSPIHMPRWAARITLQIVAVRIERLQAISEADAIAEGCPPVSLHSLDCASTPPSEHFRNLWREIHGPGTWDANPWVWVIEFKRVST